ncbi:uncharacterized protein TRAVEDRAFT_85778, partial [Trametes versicolor FP-101664 SS1]|uniref:uncharacterized protein n=1 Tax=Trametes versicolor (strain FP-101664) TaxID=717944 RepID=UPI000462325F
LLVQCQQIQDALHYTDGLGQVLQNHAIIDHCVYSVPYSNYLWHIDGHHKLICWGLVLHGSTDGSDHL